MCETNPISEGPGRSWRSIVQNEPNSQEPGADCAKRTQFRPGPWLRCPTIPLFYHSTIPIRCLSCETKPISRLRIADWGQTCGGTPALRPADSGLRRAKCAKRSQFGRVSGGDAQPTKSQSCETKPNLGGLGHVSKGGHRAWAGFGGKWNARNKPNSRRGRVGRGRRGVRRRANVQNEANLHRSVRFEVAGLKLERQACETKPISGGRDTPQSQYAIVRVLQSHAGR
jgi:hypothetical protein